MPESDAVKSSLTGSDLTRDDLARYGKLTSGFAKIEPHLNQCFLCVGFLVSVGMKNSFALTSDLFGEQPRGKSIPSLEHGLTR